MAKFKFSGFIKEYGLKKISSKALSDFSLRKLNFVENFLVLRYLKKGEVISSIMTSPFSLIKGKESENVGGLRILTDGVYIWPSYLNYYVKNGYEIDKTFLQHIRNNKYVKPSISKSMKKSAEDYFYMFF